MINKIARISLTLNSIQKDKTSMCGYKPLKSIKTPFKSILEALF